ncbi:DUF2505 domain-containing protein [Solicola gregarius]|uniref:DUF2505 domain-containing protein n=1 Tax=Solicola gregarius TaxID=2908642 RepID=A0AA46TGD3_9ACTN|nr:DUF2505 domain-containing protein [Solicola gregarius]UYM04058.1 DUF2505 domain-containing protein [Solicola gregarius]
MQLDETLEYAAGPDTVFAMLCDASWRERVCELAYAQSYDVSVEPDGDAATITVERVMPAEVPDAVKAFLGKTVEIQQVERWAPPLADGTRHAEVSVRIKGQPASMQGTSVLAGTDTSTLRVTGDVRVKVPFVGRKIEPEVAKAIAAALRIEETAAADYLA